MRLLDRATVAFLALLLLVTPWPLGSRLRWAGLAAASAVILWATVWVGARIVRGRRIRTDALVPVAVFLAFVGLQWAAGLTAYRYATALEWTRYLAYGATMLLVANVATTRWRSGALASVLLVSTILVSAFGILQHEIPALQQSWVYESPFGGTHPFGPFNNRNHFAGYALTGIGLGAGWALALRLSAGKLLGAVAAVVGSAAVLISLSRSAAVALVGMLLIVVGIQLLTGFGGLERGRLARRSVALVATAAILVALVGAALVWGGQAGEVGARLGTLLDPLREPSTRGRLWIWGDTLPMIADRPLVGWGLNTYAWAHLPYRTAEEASFPQHAHNEYLEMTAEVGLIGAGLCLWFLVGLGRAVRRRLEAADRRQRALLLGCVGGWSGILVFGLTDFPTVIPATDFALAVLAGLAVAPQPESGSRTSSGSPSPSVSTSTRDGSPASS